MKILIDSREDDSAFKIDKMPRDDFDVHAGAYETAVMADICPEMVYGEKTDNLKPTMLNDEERLRWCEGNKKDINITPNSYVGDPFYYRYIHAHMDIIYVEYAKSLVKRLDEIKSNTNSSLTN